MPLHRKSRPAIPNRHLKPRLRNQGQDHQERQPKDTGQALRVHPCDAEFGPRSVEKDLQQTEDRFRQLVENAKDIIYRYRLAPQRGFEYISPSVTDVLGYTPEVTIGCCEIERLPTGLRSRVPAKEVRPTTSLCPQLVALTMPRRAVDT